MFLIADFPCNGNSALRFHPNGTWYCGKSRSFTHFV